MVSNDLNQKYTIERYCSKIEVAKALGTNLIEPIWREINEFRKRLSIELPIFDTSFVRFVLTYIDVVQGKSAQINDKVTSYVSARAKLTKGTIAHYTFTHDMLKASLKNIARFNKIDASEITLTNIVEDKDVDAMYLPLVRYRKALYEIYKNTFDNIDEEFLAKQYAILRGEDELTSFYRSSDISTSSSRALVDRDYDQGVPAHMIDQMMGALMEYVNNFDISLAARLTAIFFMFNYVKPFESHNMEMASLLAKRVLAATDAESSSIYIPLESFICDKDFFGDISKEVKKTHDFTYAFIKGAEILNVAFEISLDRLIQVQARALDSELKLGSDEKKAKEEFGVKIEQPKVTPVRETKVEIQRRIEKVTPVEIKPNLSEKELKAKVNDLLESDPFLKKGQAHFYVYHSTIGKYYTIQQYIKFENCVYETGRTSMDNLAKLGYYRREQIKNKFVYTPINKE